MRRALKIIQRMIKSVPFLYTTIKSLELTRWTEGDNKRRDFYSNFVNANDLCFDIGANFGNRVKVLLKIGAKVVAVEPLSECVRVLTAVYGKRPDLVLINKAAGSTEGKSEIYIPDITVIASMSRGWIEAAKNSGRFASNWEKRREVEVTTIDKLIEIYGVPDFIKIDVEGFEFEVVKGLTQPVKMLSLEYAAEFTGSILSSIDHLISIGDFDFNYCEGEGMVFVLENWVGADVIKDIMNKQSGLAWGDVYARRRRPSKGRVT
jgi:FkbM family methyltransferase